MKLLKNYEVSFRFPIYRDEKSKQRIRFLLWFEIEKGIFQIFLIIFSFAYIVFITGCTPTQSVTSELVESNKDVDKEKKFPLSVYESTLNPADYDREIDVASGAKLEEKKEKYSIEIPDDSLVIQEEIIQGYRIQVFSSSNVDDAIFMKNAVSIKFPNDSVYVIFDTPVYKVRVGDFVNRYEASQRLPEFIERGYRDAWIVPDKVIQRKSIIIPKKK